MNISTAIPTTPDLYTPLQTFSNAIETLMKEETLSQHGRVSLKRMEESIRQMLQNLNRAPVQDRGTVENNISPANRRWLSEVESVLLPNICDPNLRIGDVAYKLAMSERQFRRRIRQITGQSAHLYFREIRLQTARRILENGEVRTVSELAYAVGFKTPGYFSRVYQDRFGGSPLAT